MTNFVSINCSKFPYYQLQVAGNRHNLEMLVFRNGKLCNLHSLLLATDNNSRMA